MTPTDEVLERQHSQLREARRLCRHADRCHAIGRHHQSTAVLLPTPQNDYARIGIVERYTLHRTKSGRAFTLAGNLYRAAERLLTGTA